MTKISNARENRQPVGSQKRTIAISRDGLKQNSWLPGGHLTRGLVIAAALAFVAAYLVPPEFELLTRLLASWDTSLVIMLVSLWSIIVRSHPDDCMERARADDPGNFLLVLFSVVASFAGLAGAVFLLDQPDPAMQAISTWAQPAIVLIAVVGGWLLMQTAYTLHYAKIYYSRDVSQGGLLFADEPPDDSDFAYFAFTVGMTFQVSDVEVTTKRMRRVVLKHAVISFAYNLFIFALVINIFAGRI